MNQSIPLMMIISVIITLPLLLLLLTIPLIGDIIMLPLRLLRRESPITYTRSMLWGDAE